MNARRYLGSLGGSFLLLLTVAVSGCGGTDRPYTGMSAAELSRFSAALDELSAGGRVSGAVLIAHDGNPVFTRAYGWADAEAGNPNQINTKFNIGSLNKTFTARSEERRAG